MADFSKLNELKGNISSEEFDAELSKILILREEIRRVRQRAVKDNTKEPAKSSKK